MDSDGKRLGFTIGLSSLILLGIGALVKSAYAATPPPRRAPLPPPDPGDDYWARQWNEYSQAHPDPSLDPDIDRELDPSSTTTTHPEDWPPRGTVLYSGGQAPRPTVTYTPMPDEDSDGGDYPEDDGPYVDEEQVPAPEPPPTRPVPVSTQEQILARVRGDRTVGLYQLRLQDLNYDPGPIDGRMGTLTRNAVRDFQRDNPPLRVDGILGTNTKAAIDRAWNARFNRPVSGVGALPRRRDPHRGRGDTRFVRF